MDEKLTTLLQEIEAAIDRLNAATAQVQRVAETMQLLTRTARATPEIERFMKESREMRR
jgi:hypothetical protein